MISLISLLNDLPPWTYDDRSMRPIIIMHYGSISFPLPLTNSVLDLCGRTDFSKMTRQSSSVNNNHTGFCQIDAARSFSIK